MEPIQILDEVYRILNEANDMLIDIWFNEIVFSWRWWLEIALAIIPWIIWVKVRDKKIQ